MIHEMRLQQKPFAAIAGGTKTLEIRLHDEKRQQIKIGDQIVFSRMDKPDVQIKVEVMGLHVFANFIDLFSAMSAEDCGANPDDKPEFLSTVMHGYYNVEDEANYGVLAIEIRLVDG